MSVFRVRSVCKDDGACLDPQWRTSALLPLCCPKCGDFTGKRGPLTSVRLDDTSDLPEGMLAPIARTRMQIMRVELFERWKEAMGGFGAAPVEVRGGASHEFVAIWSPESVRAALYSDAVAEPTSRCAVCTRILINANWETSTWIPESALGEATAWANPGGSGLYVADETLRMLTPRQLAGLEVREIPVRADAAPYGSVYLDSRV